MTKEGESAIFATKGNEDCHVILRGGKAPNFDAPSVAAVCDQLADAGLAPVLMVDCSHGNSQKQYKNQISVVSDVASQIAGGDARIIGIMLESHLNEGRQDHSPGCNLNYGQSITDACLGWEDSVAVLETLAAAVKARRDKHAAAE